MAISYPLSLPTTAGIAAVTLARRSVVGATKSPFTGEVQTYRHQGEWWEAEVTLPPMVAADARDWIAFLNALDGRRGTFLMGDPAASAPRGSASATPGTPLVKGASQTGEDLEIDGAPNNATGYLLAGDYIQLGTGTSARLHQVVQDANSDGSGNVTLTLRPRITTAPSDNAAVVVSDAKGLFRLTENAARWAAEPGVLYNITFSAESVI